MNSSRRKQPGSCCQVVVRQGHHRNDGTATRVFATIGHQGNLSVAASENYGQLYQRGNKSQGIITSPIGRVFFSCRKYWPVCNITASQT